MGEKTASPSHLTLFPAFFHLPPFKSPEPYVFPVGVFATQIYFLFSSFELIEPFLYASNKGGASLESFYPLQCHCNYFIVLLQQI